MCTNGAELLKGAGKCIFVNNHMPHLFQTARTNYSYQPILTVSTTFYNFCDFCSLLLFSNAGAKIFENEVGR